jgi:hypothetical protein
MKKNFFQELLIKKSITNQKLLQTPFFHLSSSLKKSKNSMLPTFGRKNIYIHQKQNYISKSNQRFFDEKKIFQKNLLQKKLIDRNIIKKKFNLKDYIKSKKKVNTSLLNLKSVKLGNVDETHLPPLLKFVAMQRKRAFLKQEKRKSSRFFKLYKGPKPRRFSKTAKNFYSKIFFSSVF